MRLESALFASREGLNVHGQALAVIGDNIANSNTTAYKTSRVEFSDLVSEGADGRESVVVSNGGNGVQMGKIRQIHDTGSIEFTGRSLDVGIAGKGFFMVGDPQAPTYTRAGNFQVNETGVLVDSAGQAVLGTPAATDGAVPAEGETAVLSELNLNNISLAGTATTAAGMVGNLDASAAITAAPANPASFKEVSAAASYVAGMTAYDSLGQERDVTVAFFKTGANTWTAQAYMDGANVGGTAGVPTQVGGNSTLTFGENGIIAEANTAAAVITATPAYAGGAAAGNFTIDLGSFTQYAGSSILSGVSQNGTGLGEVTSYQFKKDGELVAVLSSGTEVLVGTIKLADFRNVDGLKRNGNNSYIAEEDAGAFDPGTPGTGGLGGLEGSSLERSSIDIASQFVDLVIYQRGYQANSQTLGVANTMLKDTLNLIR